MFAGMLAAWKGLSPLIRYGSIAGLVALLIGGYFGWREYQRHLGKEKMEAIYETELRKQSQNATQEYVRQIDIKDRHVKELLSLNDDLRTQLDAIKQEIINHANATKRQACPVDADAVRIVNDLARVLNDNASHQRMPAASEATGEPAVEAEPPVTATEDAVYLLERIRLLTDRLAVTDAGYHKLSDYVVEQYEQAWHYYAGQVPP